MAKDKTTTYMGMGMEKGIKALQDVGLLPTEMTTFQTVTGMNKQEASKKDVLAKLLSAAFDVKVPVEEVDDVAKWLFKVEDWSKVNTKMKGMSETKRAIAEAVKGIPVKGISDEMKAAVMATVPTAVQLHMPSAITGNITASKSLKFLQDYASLPDADQSYGRGVSLDQPVGETGDLKDVVDGATKTAPPSMETGAPGQPAAPGAGATTTGATAPWQSVFRREQIAQMDRKGIPENWRQWMADQGGPDAVPKFQSLLAEAERSLKAEGKNPAKMWSKQSLRSLGLATGSYAKDPNEALFALEQVLQEAERLDPENAKKMRVRLQEAAGKAEMGHEVGGEFDEVGRYLKELEKKSGSLKEQEKVRREVKNFPSEFRSGVAAAKGKPADMEGLTALKTKLEELSKIEPGLIDTLKTNMPELERKLALAEMKPGMISSFKRMVSNLGGPGKATAKIGGAAAGALAVGLLTKLASSQMESNKAAKTTQLLDASKKTSTQLLDDIRFQEAQQRAAMGQAGMPSPQAMLMAQMLANPPLPSFRTSIGPSPVEKIDGRSPDEVMSMLAALSGGG